MARVPVAPPAVDEGAAGAPGPVAALVRAVRHQGVEVGAVRAGDAVPAIGAESHATRLVRPRPPPQPVERADVSHGRLPRGVRSVDGEHRRRRGGEGGEGRADAPAGLPRGGGPTPPLRASIRFSVTPGTQPHTASFARSAVTLPTQPRAQSPPTDSL